MNQEEEIKALIPIICPSCNHTLVVEFLTTANLLSIDEAEKILESVEKSNEEIIEVHESKEEDEEGEQEES